MAEEKRMLIVKIQRSHTETGGKPVCELWSDNPRLKFPELRLFDLSKLLTIGVDPNALDEGKSHFCRFWVIYVESDRQTQHGTAYRDVVRLEPALPEEGDEVTELLREQVAILARIEELLQAATGAREEKPRAPGEPTAQAAPATSTISIAEATQIEPIMQPKPQPEPQSEPQSEAQPQSASTEDPVLNDDQAYRHFTRDASPAIRNGLVDAAFVNELTKAVSGGVINWRTALARLQEQLAKA